MTSEESDEHLLLATTGMLRGRRAPRRVGLAVSGGGDSMAMLWLLGPWARDQGIEVFVATVDHRLRPEAADEARFVASVCEGLGLPHDILTWRGPRKGGNLQAAAREARRGLLVEWARRKGIEAILLAHTADDQAETFLLRLARGSGIGGLVAMEDRSVWGGIQWLRPFLGQSRSTLRDYLKRNGHRWLDDPSNEDEAYDRVRARKALALLEPLGIDAGSIGLATLHMGLAERALRQAMADAADRIAEERTGDVLLDFDGFVRLPHETQLRLAADAIRWLSGAIYRPRLHALQGALAEAIRNRTRTLGGVVIRRTGEGRARRIVMGREPRAAARAKPMPTTALWDGRWRLAGPHAPDLEVRMLGEAGIALCPDWRESCLERSSVLASPAVWRGDALVAAPLAGRPEGWRAEVATGFLAFLREGR